MILQTEKKTKSRLRKEATVPGELIRCRSAELVSTGRRFKTINELDPEKRLKWIAVMKELKDVKSLLYRELLSNQLRRNNCHEKPKETDSSKLSPFLKQYHELLTHPRSYERMWGISRVANLNVNTSAFIPSLVLRLFDDEEYVRCHAAWAIGEIHEKTGGGEIAVPFLIQALGEYDNNLRRYAAMSLGRIGDKSASHILRKALHIENDHVTRIELEKALKKLIQN